MYYIADISLVYSNTRVLHPAGLTGLKIQIYRLKFNAAIEIFIELQTPIVEIEDELRLVFNINIITVRNKKIISHVPMDAC